MRPPRRWRPTPRRQRAAWGAISAVAPCLRSAGMRPSREWSVMSAAAVITTCSLAYVGAGRVPSYRVGVMIAVLLSVLGVARWWISRGPVWATLVGRRGLWLSWQAHLAATLLPSW